ncbi:MAG: MYXO-CTERM sorting domain-containing protein [Pseudomonadota bacterium]
MQRLTCLCLLGFSVLPLMLPSRAIAQTCGVVLSEVNYDCALAAGVANDACEFIELGFTGTYTPGVTPVDGCGIASIQLINGSSIACGLYDTVALPSTPIPGNGLFVIGRTDVSNVDLVPTTGGWATASTYAIQNGNPDWIRLVGDSAAQDRWYAYEFNPAADTSKDCFVKAGSVGQVAYIGKDYDENTNSPPPVVREESISLCGSGQTATYVGDDEAGGLTGPLASPGEPNACDTRLPWSSADAGPEDAAAPADSGQASDAATGQDVTTTRDAAGAPDSAGQDHATSPDAGSCGALTFIGECQGTVVRWCDDGEILTYDCADDDTACGLVDCTGADCYGFDCVAATDEDCGPSEVELACDVLSGDGCRAGVCAASPVCDFDTYVENCDGAFILYCGTTRVWDEDCSLGGTEPYICGAVSGGGVDCLGLAGAFCDPGYDLNCAPGLNCHQGACEGTLTIDAGTSVPDSAVATDASQARDASTHPDGAASDAAASMDTGVPADSGVVLDSSVADTQLGPDGGSGQDALRPGDATMVLDVSRPGVDGGFTDIDSGGACGCTTSGPSGSPAWVLAVAGLVARWRRRRVPGRRA